MKTAVFYPPSHPPTYPSTHRPTHPCAPHPDPTQSNRDQPNVFNLTKPFFTQPNRKLLLAAPAGPQGAGIALHPANEDSGPGADFFVAIASPSVPAPLEGWTKGGNRPEPLHRLRTTIPRKVKGLLPSCVSKEDILKEVNSKENGSKLDDSKESSSGWRYANVVTPGVLGSAHRGSGDDVHSSGVAGNGDSPNLKTTRGKGVGGGGERPCPTPSKTRLGDLDAAEQEEQSSLRSVHGAVHGTVCGTVHGEVHGTVWGTVHGAVHGTVGERRQTYFGSDEVLLAAKSLQAAENSSRRPKKANVRRLVQHLEARLKLKGRSRTIVAPSSGRNRPHFKQLAKRG